MIVRGLEQIVALRCLKGASCAFGVFDGVHRGHAYIIERAREYAQRNGVPLAIITFERDPDELFAQGALKKLMSNEQRIHMLERLGADVVAVLPFNRQFASLEPAAFCEQTFDVACPCALHVGTDFRYGARAAGTVETLASWMKPHGCAVQSVDLLEYAGEPITATRIRACLSQGNISLANELLGRRFSLAGCVEHGRGEGADLGFRTANVHPASWQCVPADGVYAGYALVNGARYKAAISVGASPTFKQQTENLLEVHILDFAGDLYESSLDVEFQAYLRPLIAFESVDQLIATVQDNITWCRSNL